MRKRIIWILLFLAFCTALAIAGPSLLQIYQGGTGASTGAQALINLIGGSPSTNNVLTWNGSAWVPQAASGGSGSFSANSVTLFDEFIGSSTAQNLGWTANGGAGGVQALITSSPGPNNPGVFEVNGGSLSTTWEYYILGAINTGGDYLNPQTGTFKWYWRANDQNGPVNGTIRLGMFDDRGNQNSTNGFYYSASTGNGNSNWWCIQKSGGVTNSADSGVSAAAGTYHTLEVDAAGTSTVTWKIDGSTVCGGIGSTDLPNQNLTIAAEASGASSKVWLDYFRLDITTSGR
jgi:hypothetical protein